VYVVGRENIPPGVCLFAANHTSNADAPAIIGAIPRRLAVFARKSLFDIPIVGLAFRLANLSPSIGAIATPLSPASSKPWNISRPARPFLVYPRGRAVPTAACTGSRKALSSWRLKRASRSCRSPARSASHHEEKVPRDPSGKVTVRFGKPVDVSGYTVDQRNALAQQVHDAVAAQLPDDQKPAT